MNKIILVSILLALAMSIKVDHQAPQTYTYDLGGSEKLLVIDASDGKYLVIVSCLYWWFQSWVLD